MAKVGGSHEPESRSSRIRSILSEKKSQNRSGRSERGMSDGRGAVLDLPNSSLDTAKSCLQEELESIFSQENCLGLLNTRLHNSPLLGVDFPVDGETGRSPSSLCQSPSPSSLPDLLGHPGGGRAVSHASGDGRGVAVKNSTKPVIVDIDEASQMLEARYMLCCRVEWHASIRLDGVVEKNIPKKKCFVLIWSFLTVSQNPF